MKRLFFIILLLIFMFTSCASPASSDVIKSEKPRANYTSLNQSNVTALVNGNTEFALDLYQELKHSNNNLFYSPYSISSALAMVYAGARGNTEKQMRYILHYNLSQDQLHQTFNGLDNDLSRRGEGAKGKDDKGFRLHIVNAIWGQKDYKFLQQYLDTLAENYGAGLRMCDFIKAPEESRIKINKWVSDQTENRIKDLIPPEAINTLTRLVLTNAIYFNATWQHPFEKSATHNGTFNLLNGKQVSIPMMTQTERFSYLKNNDYLAVELPYNGNELSMLIILPDKDKFDNIESTFNKQLLDNIINNLKSGQVNLTMPKFEFDSEFNLNNALKTMGMTDAFSDTADFSGMTGNRDLYISDVIHKAFVSVDEAGTEAAAATAVIIKLTAIPEPPISIVIDRPFIFLIRDIKTSTILFIGRVLNPA